MFLTACFLQGSVDHCVIGVQLLAQLTAEMNQISESDANKSLTKHRKIASSFRDTQLYDIFQLSCTLLRTALENSKTLNFNDESQHGLMTHLLRLGEFICDHALCATCWLIIVLIFLISFIMAFTIYSFFLISLFPFSTQLPYIRFHWDICGWEQWWPRHSANPHVLEACLPWFLNCSALLWSLCLPPFNTVPCGKLKHRSWISSVIQENWPL